jgi:leucine dehydrogenase
MVPSLLNLSPAEFVQHLKSKRISTFHFITQNGKFVASHAELQPIADTLMDRSICDDYDNHEGLFCTIGEVSGVLLSAAVHRTCRGPGSGGVRNWLYASMDEFFRDGLRLSKGMTHKNALAGIHWGG